MQIYEYYSVNDICQQLGISRDNCNYHIRQLSKHGPIDRIKHFDLFRTDKHQHI